MTTTSQLQKSITFHRRATRPSRRIVRRFLPFWACALLVTATLTHASAQQFTLEATATTATNPVGPGQVYNYVDFAALGNNIMVTAVQTAVGHLLEVTVWQYVPPCGPRKVCEYPTNTILREGSMSLYTLAPSSWGANFHITALGPNAFATVGLDAINNQVHVTSWTVDASGNPHDTSDVYSTPGGSVGAYCALAALDANQIVVVESDDWVQDNDSYVISAFGIQSNGTITRQTSFVVENGWGTSPVNVFKVNTSQVVVTNEDQNSNFFLTSVAVNPDGENIVEQTTVYPPINELWSVVGATTSPGVFVTAGTAAETPFDLEPEFWSVDTWGNFTLAAYGFEYPDPTALIGIASFNGVPITATGGSSFRLDAWAVGKPLTDLATLTEGRISTPAMAQISQTVFAVAFQNSGSNLEIQVFNYNPI
jgi:hypothetical protein